MGAGIADTEHVRGRILGRADRFGDSIDFEYVSQCGCGGHVTRVHVEARWVTSTQKRARSDSSER